MMVIVKLLILFLDKECTYLGPHGSMCLLCCSKLDYYAHLAHTETLEQREMEILF